MMLALLTMVATAALALAAQARVRSTFQRFSQVRASSGYTGAQVAAEILRRNGIEDVSIHEQPGFLSDHYDPLQRRLVLSSEVFHGGSLSALGVAAHEVGHAIQHQRAYLPLHLRMAAVGTTQIASQVVTWLPVLGMATHILSTGLGLALMAVGWGVIMAFNLVTLPVEYDASRRAKEQLARLGIVRSGQEAAGVSSVLNAAALTYVAAFITSLVYLLWYLLPLLGQHSREEE